MQQLRCWHVPVERRAIGVCKLLNRPLFSRFGGFVRQLHCGNLPIKYWPGILRKLRSWKLLCHNWPVGDHGMSCRQLLWRDGTFSSVGDVRRGLLCGGLRLGLLGLRRGDVHLEHDARFMFELPNGNLSCAEWSE